MKKLIAILIFFTISCSNPEQKPVNSNPENYTDNHIKELAEKARIFCHKKNLNTQFCFIVDLGKHSGYKRFYVYDFVLETVRYKFMVSHGCGPNPLFWTRDFTKDKARISNKVNSRYSSIGKYLVEERGKSKFGIGVKYNLTGLDSTNNNARKRAVVLHSWEKVTDHETYPEGTAEGWGCPAISNKAMSKLDEMLKKKSSKTLLWIIN